MKKSLNLEYIKLTTEEFLDDFVFWGMRYCIGRKSYASDMWSDILRVLEENREKFLKTNYDRLEFFAKDIRSEISSKLGWLDGIRVLCGTNSTVVTDAYSLLVRHLMDNPEEDFQMMDYEIDCRLLKVTSSPRVDIRTGVYGDFPCIDFHGWIKLANSIDRRKVITVEKDGGNPEKYVCVEIPIVDDWRENKVSLVWSPIDTSSNRFLVPEYITKIEDAD